MSNAMLGSEGSEMSGRPGRLIESDGRSGRLKLISMSKAKLGREGNAGRSGRPGSDIESDGRSGRETLTSMSNAKLGSEGMVGRSGSPGSESDGKLQLKFLL